MAERDSQELAMGYVADRYVSGRIKALVLDLVNDDWSMALPDLERLYRALKTGSAADVDEPSEVPEIVGATIYHDDDGTTLEEFCQVPTATARARGLRRATQWPARTTG